MIKIKLNLLIFVSLIFASCHSEKKAELVLSSDTYDFAGIEKDSVYNGRITITNKGNIPLIISDVDADCGCTSVFLSKKTIQPKDTCMLNFKYTT
jgi:hypothetical protein